jgi:hypothetical protein
MGATALYRDPVPFRPARAEVHLGPDTLALQLSDGRYRRCVLDGCTPAMTDGYVDARIDDPLGLLPRSLNPGRSERRFVRMLILERGSQRDVIITPPDQGAIAPSVVRVPEAPAEAVIVDARPWDSLAEWILGGGRFAGCSIADLSRLAAIATPQFAVLIGEVAAQRALELLWMAAGPRRSGFDIEYAQQPLTEAARHSSRAAEALVAALAHAAGATRRRRRW